MNWMLTSCRACSIAVFAAILICGCKQEAPLTFEAGTYEVTAQGHNGDIRLSVTFSDSCITDISPDYPGQRYWRGRHDRSHGVEPGADGRRDGGSQ